MDATPPENGRPAPRDDERGDVPRLANISAPVVRPVVPYQIQGRGDALRIFAELDWVAAEEEAARAECEQLHQLARLRTWSRYRVCVNGRERTLPEWRRELLGRLRAWATRME